MSRISRNLSVILRAERMIARRHMAVLRNQSGMLVFAALVGAIGLVMLNISGFYWLKTMWSPQGAALAIALANFVLAAVLGAIAMRLGTGSELEPITEVRDMAIEEIEVKLQEVVSELHDVAGNVRRMARDPLGSVVPALVVPLMTTLVKATRKSDSGKK